MKRKIFNAVLAFCMFTAFLPCAARAKAVASGSCGAGVTWTFDDSGTLTISGEGAMEDYQVYPSAPYLASDILHKIKAVNIESGVTSIGSCAFTYADNIESVSIADTVSSIGDDAFHSCHALTEINIPSGVTTIGGGVFRGCSSLATVNADGGSFLSEDGILFDKDKTEIIVYPPAKDGGAYSITDEVVKIHDSAFYGCEKLTEINIPDNVTEIGDRAFDDCYGLISAELGSGLRRIGDYAFENCKALTEITVPDSVTDLGKRAFCGCINLKTARVGGVTDLKSSVFNGCSALDNVVLPDTLKTIGDYAFAHCAALTEINIPSGVTTIDGDAFENCKALTEITVPSSVKTIGQDAFYGCKALARADISDGVISIGDSAFYGCEKLTEINIPDSVTEIGGRIFYNCEGLTSVNFGDGLAAIPEYAFYGCTTLRNVHIGSGVATICAQAFNGCKKITNINIPAGVMRIERYAFNLCTGLKDVYYDGTRAQWDAITIDEMNNRLLDAALHCSDDAQIPEIGIDYTNETLTGFNPDGSYTIDGETVLPENGVLPIGAYIGKTITIVKTGGESTSDSEPQTLTIPARPAAPMAAAVPVTAVGRSDGKITGVSAGMEYRSKGGDWRDCAETEIGDLKAGTYEIRLKATDSSFCGETAEVFVDTICVKITATYNDGCLTDVNIEKVNLSEITPPENSETGKTFYWENTENMKPIKLN